MGEASDFRDRVLRRWRRMLDRDDPAEDPPQRPARIRDDDDWQDIADDDAWDELPGERKPWRRRREAERDTRHPPDEEDGWDEDAVDGWDEEWDEHDPEDWDEDEEDRRPEGWQDPEAAPRRKRRSVLSTVLLAPFKLLALPFKIVFWAVAICLAWVAVYIFVDPPTWTYLDNETDRLGETTVIWKDIDDISPNLVRAVIAAEDARFCEHWGIDMDATMAAIDDYVTGRRLVGGSTLTQQTAKNVFLWHDRSVLRKILEVPFALAMETMWGKERILEVYLNVAEFDEATFGAEAAARGYFGKRAKDLSLAEAARLAAVLPDPKDRSAARPSGGVERRARRIADGARTIENTGADACALGDG